MAPSGNFICPVGQIKTGTITVSGTAIKVSADSAKNVPLAGRCTVEVYCKTGTLYIGGKDVTTNNGIPVNAGDSKIIPVHNQGGAAGIYMTGTGTAIVAEYTE